ncbi:MAG TPA: hypothetical protein PLM07_02905 [Candidatus Rifleibacterium sp.]|nr:hypothetical protein [Candidatus Rifleibacterium sp.]HPT44834.1 hypothetical protein [Candidatus Rifleibacterium sp.]
MEAIRRFLQLLGIIKDRRLKTIQNGSGGCATCTPEELKTWQDFVAWIDLLEASSEHSARVLLAELLKPGKAMAEQLAMFQNLVRSRDDWGEVLRFAELPIQFAPEAFELLNSEFARAVNISDQIAIIGNSFAAADPTHTEMLLLLIEGSVERQPQPQTRQAAELVERERAARERLKMLLQGEMSDVLRWWLIRTINCTVGAARSFIRDTVKSRRDLRLQCMLLPMLLKTGFEWAGRCDRATDETGESMQSHMYAHRLNSLIELIEPA